MQQVEYGEISGVSFISVVRQKVTWNAWNLFILLKNDLQCKQKRLCISIIWKKISWNLNTYCDLTSFEVKKLHVFAQFFLFFFRQLVFLVALQNHYMQKVTWDHCRCPFSQGWHLKKKAILGVLRSICWIIYAQYQRQA